MREIELFAKIVSEHYFLGYGLLFLAMIIEGEFLLMSAGILANIGALDVGYAFVVALLGTFANDAFWYYLGAKIKDNFGHWKYLDRIESKINKIFPSFQEKPGKGLFLSKFVAGTNHPVLIFSGFIKLNLKKYIEIQLWASLIWTSIFYFLGYFMSFAAVSISHKLDKFIFTSLIFVAAVMLLDRLVFRRYYKYFKKNNGNNIQCELH